MIEKVFNETCLRYERILKNYYPSFDSNGFTERNLTFNFCCSFLKESGDENLIIWQEVPIKKKNKLDKSKHFDSLIIDDRNRKFFLIEAKRLINKKKMDNIEKDLTRLKSKWGLINLDDDLPERRNYTKYLVILSDIWFPVRGSKMKNKLRDRFEKELGIQERPQFYYKEIKKNVGRLTDDEMYYLLCKVWKIVDN